MQSHIFNMLITALIISTSFHVIFFDKRKHPWHHHFWVYFGALFVGGVGFAWLMLATEANSYY